MEDMPEFGTGHNKPPGPIDQARAAYKSLSDFLLAHPVIETAADAKDSKLYLDRSKATLADLEAARDAKAAPLYDAWKAARAEFQPALDGLSKLLKELNARLTVFVLAEEKRRQAEAAEKVRIAQELEAKAREAERIEREAKENAAVGDLEADVGTAIQEADAAYDEFQRAARQAVFAEKDSHVKIAGGFSRSVGLRTSKIPVVEDAAKALAAMGLTDSIRAALITSARAYKKLNGSWPAGIGEIEERKL